MGGLCAGPLAGVSIPLFLWLGTEKKSKMTAFAGIAGATAMVVRISCQHVVDGLWGKPCWAWFLAPAQADAARPVGTCGYLGGIAPCHAWARLVAD